MMVSLASLAADCVGGISWTLLRTSRLLQAMVADPAPRMKPAATRAPAVEDSTAGDEAAAAEITRLNQVISALQSQLMVGAEKLPGKERLEEEPESSQDEILKVRQELDTQISGLQGEVASLTEQLKVSELEKKKLKGAAQLALTRVNKKAEEERRHSLQKDNDDLIAEQEHLLGLLDGLRAQLWDRDREVRSIQVDMELLKSDKESQDLILERMQKDLAYKTWEIEELKKDVEYKEWKKQWEAEVKELELEVLKNCTHVL